MLLLEVDYIGRLFLGKTRLLALHSRSIGLPILFRRPSILKMVHYALDPQLGCRISFALMLYPAGCVILMSRHAEVSAITFWETASYSPEIYVLISRKIVGLYGVVIPAPFSAKQDLRMHQLTISGRFLQA